MHTQHFYLRPLLCCKMINNLLWLSYQVRVCCGCYRQVYLCCGGPHTGWDLLLNRTLWHHRGSLGVCGPVPCEQVRPRGNCAGWETVHHWRHHLIFHFQTSVCVWSWARGRGRWLRRLRCTQDTQRSRYFGTRHPRQLLGEQIKNELCPLLPQDDRSQREAVRVWGRVRDPPCFLWVAGLPIHRSVQPRHGWVDDPCLYAHRAQRPRGGCVRQADHGVGWTLLQRPLQWLHPHLWSWWKQMERGRVPQNALQTGRPAGVQPALSRVRPGAR